MTDPLKKEVEEASYLDMSDADMLNAAPPVAEVVEETAEVTEQAEKPEVAADESTTLTPEVGDEGDDADDVAADQAAKADAKKPEVPGKTEAKPTEVEQPAEVAVNFEAEYKKIFAPFKANGREVEIKSAEDAIALMQMGANYNKKMAALKPNLKLMKLLENNGLMNEERISYLIDLEKKNPDAINKLVKDSGINPMDLDAEKAGEYKPKIHAVDDREIDLDTVLDELQDSPSYNRTLDVVSKQWDGASKQVISQSPQLLKVINAHMERGIYDVINKEVENEKLFGRLTGLSDIEAYRKVGDAIEARGGFNHLGSSQKNPARGTIVPPKPKAGESDELKEKRRAAGSTKPAASGTAAKEFNPLGMSDEEFSKVSVDRFR